MHPVYFVRHGESEWNVADRICGQTDVALTDLGHAQAIATGQKIAKAGIVIDEILYSPLSRAAETARHISEITGVPMRMEPRLVEQNFGKWEGTSPRNAADFFEAKKQFVCRHEGGESMLQLAQRIYNLLDEIKKDIDQHHPDIYLYGHTHLVKEQIYNNCLILNPGSITLPRDDWHGSYIILTIDKKVTYKLVRINVETFLNQYQCFIE